MEKLIKTLDKTLPSWVDDLFPDVVVKDDKHLISSYVKPAEDKIGLNRFQLHHFQEPTASASAVLSASAASSASSSSASHGGVTTLKRKRGTPPTAALLSKKQQAMKKNAAAAAAMAAAEAPLDVADSCPSSSSTSQAASPDNEHDHYHYNVLNQLLCGNRLTMYDFVEKPKHGTEILLLLPSGGGSKSHHDAKLRSLLQAAQYKVPVVTRIADASSSSSAPSSSGSSSSGDTTTTNKQQLFYVFRGSLVRVERHNGFFHGVTLARNPPNIVVEIPTTIAAAGHGSSSGSTSSGSVTCLTFNMLKCVHDFQIWSPQLHRDFEPSFSGLIWKKILAPHGNGQNYAERNRLIATLIKLVADDAIRTAQVCCAARSVQEKITSKKLSNALRSLDTKTAKSIMSKTTTTTTAVATTTTSAKTTTAARGANKKPQEKKKVAAASPPIVEQPRKRRATAMQQASAAAARAAKKKKAEAAAAAAKRASAATTATATPADLVLSSLSSSSASASSPAEVSILSAAASSGMQRLLDAADVADSLDERESSSFEEQESSCGDVEGEEQTAAATGHEEEEASSFLEAQERQGEQLQQQGQEQHHPHGLEMSLLGLKHKDPLGFLCSVVVDKPTVNLTAGAAAAAFADYHHVTENSNVSPLADKGG